MTEPVDRGSIVVQLVKRGWRPPPLTTEQAQRLLDDMEFTHGSSTLDLSAAELDSLELAANGLTMAQSAARLKITPDTHKERLDRARERLGARNTTHAVALAVHDGLIELREAA